VTGYTNSTDFPTTVGAFQTTSVGTADAFVSKLNATGSALVYSTYLGATETGGSSIAVDASDNAYATGDTSSSNFPTTAGAFQTKLGGGVDAFVTKLNATGSALVYSTYLGGAHYDAGQGIAIDPSDNAYIAGYTNSSNFPTSSDAFQTKLGGGLDAFVSKLSTSGSALLYSTYVGGGGFDVGRGIAVDATANAYVAGGTNSSHFPTTPGAFQTTLRGTGDAFVSKFSFAAGGPAVSFSPPSLTFAPQPVGTFSSPLEATLTNTGSAALHVTNVTRSGDFYLTCNCLGTLQPGAFCTMHVTFTPTSAGTRSGDIFIKDKAPGSPQKLSLSGTGSGTGSIILTLSPPSLEFGSVMVGTSSSPQTVTVTNIGTVAASFVDPFGFTIRGADPKDFGEQLSCGMSLAPNQSCTVAVTFTPKASGARKGIFLVRQGAASVQIPVSGTGT